MHRSDARVERIARRSGPQREVVQRDRSCIRTHRARQHAHQRGLAGAVLAKERVNLTRRGFEVDRVEGDGRAEAPGYGTRLKQSGGVMRLRRTIMAHDVGQRRFARGQRAVELLILNILEDGPELGAGHKTELDQIVAADQARRPNLVFAHPRHRMAAEVIEAEIGAGGERVDAAPS
jgi:hypothetical protein